MKKVMIISGYDQFGYHTDTYNYCYYLRERFSMSYISYYKGLEKINLKGVKNYYIPFYRNKYLRGALRIVLTIYYILIQRPNIIFITYSKKCSVLKKIFFWIDFIVDIRTTEINSNNDKREDYNYNIRKECEKFDNITVISDGVRELLSLDRYKTHILPLGGKSLINIEKEENISSKFSLIYVGTFFERRIEDTIIAFNKLSDKYLGKDMEYNIIGFFETEEDKNLILQLINNNKYNNIKFHGRVHNEQLGKYFSKANVGISYIPITDYFNYQPPTKTYEYLFNGLYTIATKTVENSKIINNINGILIEDNMVAVFNAMEKIYLNKINSSRSDIFNTIKEYNWESICDNLGEYFDNILLRKDNKIQK